MNKHLRLALRAIVYILLASMLVGLLIAVGFIAYNNRSVDAPSREELSVSLERSIVWMENNENEILGVNNPILWYKVKSVAEATDNSRLKKLYSLYQKKFNQRAYEYQRLWSPLFEPGSKAYLQLEDIAHWRGYVRHWMYALHCSEVLGESPEIAAQNYANYCGDAYLFNVTCTAHQMTAILFMKKNNCGEAKQIDETISQLQARLVNLMTFDPRVVDIYMQRALKLAESGKSSLIKAVWLRRILDAQLPDGGWANFQPLIYVGDNKYIGFGHASSRTGNPRGASGGKGLSLGEVHSTFHATAQSFMLLSLILGEKQ